MNKLLNTTIPILVKVWADDQAHEMRYIRRSLPSLLKSDLPVEARVILVDDCSPNPQLQHFLNHLATEHNRTELWVNEVNLGPNKGQEVLVPKVWNKYPESRFLVCCDDDIIYHPGWLQHLIQVYYEARDAGINGVFSALNTPAKPHYKSVMLPSSNVLLKERQMALNWLVPREVYDAVGPFRDVGVAYDTDYNNRLTEAGFSVACLQPSWVQNIGYHGAYQNDETLTAQDYIGNIGFYLTLREFYYKLRRGIINTAEIIPEGRAKEFLKFIARPIRRLLSC